MTGAELAVAMVLAAVHGYERRPFHLHCPPAEVAQVVKRARKAGWRLSAPAAARWAKKACHKKEGGK